MRKRRSTAAAYQAHTETGPLPPRARSSRLSREVEQRIRLSDASNAAEAHAQQAGQTYVRNALISLFLAKTRLPRHLADDPSIRLVLRGNGTMALTSQVTVEITEDEWQAHVNALLVPFSGPISYDPHPAPPPPAPPCQAWAPPHYGRMRCALPSGHPLPHQQGGQRWRTVTHL